MRNCDVCVMSLYERANRVLSGIQAALGPSEVDPMEEREGPLLEQRESVRPRLDISPVRAPISQLFSSNS